MRKVQTIDQQSKLNHFNPTAGGRIRAYLIKADRIHHTSRLLEGLAVMQSRIKVSSCNKVGSIKNPVEIDSSRPLSTAQWDELVCATLRSSVVTSNSEFLIVIKY